MSDKRQVEATVLMWMRVGRGGQVAVWRLEAKSLLAPGPSADVVLFIINTSLGGLNSD